ncbi:LOW QUALITY PROTEIN: Retrovirus Polyprotein [Phytophthora palmivora]|uniref:Retrovirus Polyprotein n=1 Tax=Phytophthora palmivora TaxID=4796 RepID=A0A2P4XGQ4_9STRA|nr:LOW QUALITY PROTEIN: Retrovirus Polyprotein [Phytophthora palmivora]
MIGDADISEAVYQKVVQLLTYFESLYNGHLGRMKLPDYVLPILDNASPIHARPYSIPKCEEEGARKELQRHIELEVIEQIFDREWASPAFFLKKPDGRLRLLTDFRGLNNIFFVIGLKYGLLCKTVVTRKQEIYCILYSIWEISKRMPMGISTAPDEYQAGMAKILGDFDFVIVYLDDILIFSKSAKDHLEHLRSAQDVQRHTQWEKCHIFCKTVEYLGFTLSAAGIQPQEKKIRAITRIAAPRNKKQLRRFLGMVNYYRETVAGKSALLKPLTRITPPKAAFVWTSIENEAFEGVKKVLASAVLLSFSDFTKPFEIYADASGKQLGGLIQQDRKLIACYSRSLTPAQQNYTTTDLELLSVVEILKEYRTMLLGFPIIVHTDHKNLIYPTETSLQIKRWKLLLAEYRLTCQYIQEKVNIGADAFSRMELEIELKNLEIEDETIYIEPVDCVVEGRHIKQHQQAD